MTEETTPYEIVITFDLFRQNPAYSPEDLEELRDIPWFRQRKEELMVEALMKIHAEE